MKGTAVKHWLHANRRHNVGWDSCYERLECCSPPSAVVYTVAARYAELAATVHAHVQGCCTEACNRFTVAAIGVCLYEAVCRDLSTMQVEGCRGEPHVGTA